jgi:hypothetical protein
MTDEYDHLNPDDVKKAKLEAMRDATKTFAAIADKLIPAGPDKTHAIRTFRTAVMWMNHAISHARKDSEGSD